MAAAFDRSYAGSSEWAWAVTPGAGVGKPFRRLYIGGTGNVEILLSDGATTVVYSAVPVGTYIRVQGVNVLSAGTTATLIVAES